MIEFVVRLDNHPGALSALTDVLGDAGINIEALYTTGITEDLVEIALVCDNPKSSPSPSTIRIPCPETCPWSEASIGRSRPPTNPAHRKPI